MSLKTLADKVLTRDKTGTSGDNNIHNLSQVRDTKTPSSGTEDDVENQLEQACIYSGNGNQEANLHFENVSWRYFYNSHCEDLKKAYSDNHDDKIILSMAMEHTAVDYVTMTYPDYHTWPYEVMEEKKKEAIQILVKSGLPNPMTLQECEEYFQQRKNAK